MFSGCSFYKKIRTIHLFFVCLKKNSYQLYRFPPTWAQGGFPFLDLKFFSFGMQALFHMNSCGEFVRFLIANLFVVSHFIFIMAVSSHCDSLSLRVLFSNFQRYLQKILSRWHHFFSCCLVFCTDPPLIIFHCPLSSHPKDSSTTIQLSADCT